VEKQYLNHQILSVIDEEIIPSVHLTRKTELENQKIARSGLGNVRRRNHNE